MVAATRVVLLHGLGADHRAFQRFERLLPDEWDLHLLDLLGHGDAPKPEHGYSLDEHGDYIASRLRERWSDAEVQPPVLAGHSYGASTSVAVAARHPGIVRALALLDPILHLDAEDGADGRADHLTSPHGAGVAVDTNVAGDLGTATQQMFAARRQGSMADTVDRLYRHESPALRRWITSTWETMHVGVLDEFDQGWTRFAEHVACPVTIIHGELERGGGGDLAVHWFDEPTVVPIAGAGHYLHASHAREVAAAVTAAVARAT